jgi:tetratricopeptide (TPR) repeat protein
MFNALAGKFHSMKLRLVWAAMLLPITQLALSAPTLDEIQGQWDVTNFELTEKAQVSAFEQLQIDAAAYTEAHPGETEGWIWRGIIDSSFAGAKGGLGALSLAKSARKHLDKAIKMDGEAMQGSAYSSQGTLYYSVPGWPIGFGNDDKAKEFLLEGLRINPDGIDSNYFYAEFLMDQREPEQALSYYKKALKAEPRKGRAVADQGRRKQILVAIEGIG